MATLGALFDTISRSAERITPKLESMYKPKIAPSFGSSSLKRVSPEFDHPELNINISHPQPAKPSVYDALGYTMNRARLNKLRDRAGASSDLQDVFGGHNNWTSSGHDYPNRYLNHIIDGGEANLQAIKDMGSRIGYTAGQVGKAALAPGFILADQNYNNGKFTNNISNGLATYWQGIKRNWRDMTNEVTGGK